MTGEAKKGSRIGRIFKRLALFALVAVTATAAAWWLLVEDHPLPATPRPRAPLPDATAQRVTPDRSEPLAVTMERETAVDGKRIRYGKLTSRRVGVAKGREVNLELHVARNTTGPKAPAIVVTPILGGDYEIERIIADDLAGHGFHALIVDRHVPAEPGFEPLEDAMAGMLAARRRAIDWLDAPEVDRDRIGAYGVSLGGLVTTMLTAVEPRIRASVIIMAGGDLAAVLGRSVEHEACALRLHYGLAAEPTTEALAKFEADARKVFQTCPLMLAPHADPATIFMVTTRRDTSVPSDTQMRLYEALGHPKMMSLPTGHYTAIVYLPLITSRARAFLNERFAAAAPEVAAGR